MEGKISSLSVLVASDFSEFAAGKVLDNVKSSHIEARKVEIMDLDVDDDGDIESIF